MTPCLRIDALGRAYRVAFWEGKLVPRVHISTYRELDPDKADQIAAEPAMWTFDLYTQCRGMIEVADRTFVFATRERPIKIYLDWSEAPSGWGPT